MEVSRKHINGAQFHRSPLSSLLDDFPRAPRALLHNELVRDEVVAK